MKKETTLKLVLLVICALLGLFSIVANKNISKFKKEYESLNGLKNSEGKEYINVNVPNDNPIVYADYDQIFNVLDNSGIIYFGFPECPWCRNAVPVLMDAAKETGLDKIYYLNNLNDRDMKVLKDGIIITEKEGSENYNKLLTRLGDDASVYEGLNDETVRRIYFPTVIAVKNGKIVGHVFGTVDSQTDPYTALNDKQKEELKKKYTLLMERVLSCESADNKC